MTWKKSAFQNFKLYAVTNIVSEDETILRKIESAYRGGADIIQMRSKILSDHILFEIGMKIRLIADKYQKLFFVNDRLDLAMAVSADGIHIGQNDLPISVIRQVAKSSGREFLIGKSTHSVEQASKAVQEGADYIGVGPIFETPTKPGRQPVGLELIEHVHQKIKIPFVAIGGINLSNVKRVLSAGAERIAVVRAIFEAEDTYERTKQLCQSIKEFDSLHV